MGIGFTGDSLTNCAVVIDYPFSDGWIAFPIWFAAPVAFVSPFAIALAACWFVSLCGRHKSIARE